METLCTDCQNVLLSFLWKNYTYSDLKNDTEYYIKWHCIPNVFLQATEFDSTIQCLVPSPYRKNNAFVPRMNLAIPHTMWNNRLERFCRALNKERIRELKTYKGCIKRWCSDTIYNRHVEYYDFIYHKILRKITPYHFGHSRGSLPPFLTLCLDQIYDAQP